MNQGNIQYYGSFGFTETHLLIALLSRKQITYTIRIPLDIKSIKIKRTAVFKEYVIDIGFNDGTPCRITASPNVLTIDSQKENLPQFIEYLKSKSPKNEATELKNISGEKIRWQYFNTFIYVMLACFPVPPVMMIIMGIKENNLDLGAIVEALPLFLTIWGVFLAPFVVLSLLNRFFFGKIIGVANDEGLHLENSFIPWENIQKIVYAPGISTINKANYTFATVFVNAPNKTGYTFDIIHFPAYGLRKIKKLHPEVDISLGKNALHLMLFALLAPILISVIIVLIM